MLPYTAIDEVNTNVRHPGVDRGVQQVHAADDVVGVVETLDEVTQALSRICGQVVDVVEAAIGEQPIDERVIDHTAADKSRCSWYVLPKSAAQVVEDGDVVAARDERVGHVRADEPGPTGHEHSGHGDESYPGFAIRDSGIDSGNLALAGATGRALR